MVDGPHGNNGHHVAVAVGLDFGPEHANATILHLNLKVYIVMGLHRKQQNAILFLVQVKQQGDTKQAIATCCT